MERHFTSPLHRERFMDMMAEDGTYPGDSERGSLFYIIAGNDDLYRKRRFIYDPREHVIRACLASAEVDFSSSMRSLIRLGFNLYNGWSDEYTTPRLLFNSLDDRNLLIAEKAIMIRFHAGLLGRLTE